MAKKLIIRDTKLTLCLFFSIILNILLTINLYVGGGWKYWNLSWSSGATVEVEAVAAVSCSSHGSAYLDGLVLEDGLEPLCESHTCYSGPDCSHIDLNCVVNADRFLLGHVRGILTMHITYMLDYSGDSLFLEPFWMQHAASSAVLVAGWHRMSYIYDDQTHMSKALENLIRKLHSLVGNAVTDKRCIVFGPGSTQVISAAVHALSPNISSSPARVVATIPYYGLYKQQTDYFESVDFKFQGDTSFWKNSTDSNTNLIEFVTSPNNPDGQLNKAVIDGPNVKTIHDRAYYWPHFTPIPAPADEDLVILTLSKLSGHAGTRFGWASVKDKNVCERMVTHMTLNSMGVSRDTQLRALKLLKVILEGNGKEIFEFGFKTLNKTLSSSKRFSLQNILPQYCTFFRKVRDASSVYAWLKCEREEDEDCFAVLKAANIVGREGSKFSDEDRFVRLSMIRRKDDFDALIQRLKALVSGEDEAKAAM